MKCHRLIAALPLMLAACTYPTDRMTQGRWIDLTHDFSDKTIYWPNADHFKLETVFDGTTDKGYHYSANRYTAAEHGGTHMDAPIHFDAAGETVERIALNQTIGPAIMVDVSGKAKANRDYLIGVADLQAWENTNGRIPDGSIVLLRTGYDRYWPDAEQYLGTAERGTAAIARLHFPGLGPDAAQWLVQQRHIKAVGLDTASIDYGQSTRFECHRIFAHDHIPIFENLKGLDQLPATGSEVVALPMKIEGGSGAPLRAVAVVRD